MRKPLLILAACGALLLAIGPKPRLIEELRIGGGYGSQPNGGADFEADGDIFTDGNVTVAGTVTGASFADAALVGHWPLNEGTGTSVADIGPYSHTGSIVGGTGSWSEDSPFRASYTFASSRVDCGNAAPLDIMGPQTITAWIKPFNWGGASAGMIVSKNDGGAFSDGWWVYQPNASLRFRRRYSGSYYGSWRSANNSIVLNRWQFVAVTYDHSSTANDPVFYVNGRVSATVEEQAPAGLAMTFPSESLLIGNEKNLNFAFAGRIADVRLYRRILTADEIQALYRSGSENPTFQTVATAGDATLGGDLDVSGGDVDAGVTAAVRGVVSAWQGAGGNTPGCLRLGSPNGSAWYVFVEDDGTLRVHSALPATNTDGSIVGTQN